MGIIKALSNAVKHLCWMLNFGIWSGTWSATTYKTLLNTGCILRNTGIVQNKAAAEEEIRPETDICNRKNINHSTQKYYKWQRCCSKEIHWEMLITDTSVYNLHIY